MVIKNTHSSRTREQVRLHESLLTVREAAKWLRVHEKTLYKWIAGGVVPHARIRSRAIRLRLADLQKAVQCHDLNGSF